MIRSDRHAARQAEIIIIVRKVEKRRAADRPIGQFNLKAEEMATLREDRKRGGRSQLKLTHALCLSLTLEGRRLSPLAVPFRRMGGIIRSVSCLLCSNIDTEGHHSHA